MKPIGTGRESPVVMRTLGLGLGLGLCVTTLLAVGCGPVVDDLGGEDGPSEPTPEALCAQPDPETGAFFELDLGEYPVARDEAWGGAYQLEDAMCFVNAITLDDSGDAPRAVTELGCVTGDVENRVIVTTSRAADSDLAWSSLDEVRLSASWWEDTELSTGVYRSMRMTDASGRLLLAAFDDDVLAQDRLAPLTATADNEFCGERSFDEVQPIALTFAAGDDEVEIVGGHHGTLQTDDGDFRIDLAEASIGHCCHYDKWHAVLIQRIRPGA